MKKPPRPVIRARQAPRARRALAALAAAAFLLGNHSGELPAILDLPAYDPAPGPAEDAFIYPAENLMIDAVDGRTVAIGPRYWIQVEPGSDELIPLGPKPSRHVKARHYMIADKFSYDSALLNPGPHRIAVRALAYEYAGDDVFDIFMSRQTAFLSFTAEPRATYWVVRRKVPVSAGGPFWVLVLKSTCPVTDGDWIWPLEWDCYKHAEIVGSLKPALIGRRFSDFFKVD